MAVKGKGFEGPLDPVQDFQEPTVTPDSPAAEELDLQPHEEEVITEATDAPPAEEQLELEGVPPAETPKVIRNGKMLTHFVRPHFQKEESGERYVGFEFSFPLTMEHSEDGHLPEEVLRQWAHMREGNVKRTEVESVAMQTLAVGLVPDDPDHDMILVSAVITHPILANVEEKGSGKRNKVIRFSFRAMVEQNENFARFAVDHHGDQVWINMQRTHGRLFE